jgi:hypothetical protein
MPGAIKSGALGGKRGVRSEIPLTEPIGFSIFLLACYLGEPEVGCKRGVGGLIMGPGGRDGLYVCNGGRRV